VATSPDEIRLAVYRFAEQKRPAKFPDFSCVALAMLNGESSVMVGIAPYEVHHEADTYVESRIVAIVGEIADGHQIAQTIYGIFGFSLSSKLEQSNITIHHQSISDSLTIGMQYNSDGSIELSLLPSHMRIQISKRGSFGLSVRIWSNTD
jgi:myosin-crossreactive antigen